MDPFENSFLAVAVQVAGVLMVAAVLRPFGRLVPGRNLNYWWVAWVVLAVSLAFLYAAFRALRSDRPAYIPLMSGYCFTEYLFGFLVWAGCQELTAGDRLRPRHWLAFLPFVPVAVALPIFLPDFRNQLFPVHSVFVGGLFAAAFLTLRQVGAPAGIRSSGPWLARLSVGGLVLLFWHYPFVILVAGHFDPEWLVPYLEFWRLYDLLLKTGLAFSMVVLAADRVRAELADRNRQLASATAELGRAARTDPLTGLYNRRALDDLADDLTSRRAAGCVAALDMNDLKPINDECGHAAGDAAIQVVARALRNLFRVTDPIFRTGGDEFLIVLVGGNRADLASRLEKLNGGIVARLPGCDKPVTLQVAWGVAEFGLEKDLWAATQDADATMYDAKKRAKSEFGQSANPDPPGSPMI